MKNIIILIVFICIITSCVSLRKHRDLQRWDYELVKKCFILQYKLDSCKNGETNN